MLIIWAGKLIISILRQFDFEKDSEIIQKIPCQRCRGFQHFKTFLRIANRKDFFFFKAVFPVFLSCNEASKTCSGTKKKTEDWCGRVQNVYLFL